ncbi:hypothetical protein [Microbacterium sp. 10M-3C3]|jgi:hypothetical protein|uniref:hypothetical protein n=1 Tax=Microbacterium sp. 10M-3C3 TaxID=2483401 RepID=UPI000F6308F8|nr:hypothetical protein [Microbacterium sp. 10M-3C3]
MESSASVGHRDDDDAALACLIDEIVDIHAAIASLEAELATRMAATQQIAYERTARQPLPSQMRELEERSIAAEIGLATRVNDRAVQNRMHDALELIRNYPAAHSALADGRISSRHAAVIVETGRALQDPDARALYEATVLERTLRDTARRGRGRSPNRSWKSCIPGRSRNGTGRR